jgi:quercetin dioxygenase-like cupin family protein
MVWGGERGRRSYNFRAAALAALRCLTAHIKEVTMRTTRTFHVTMLLVSAMALAVAAPLAAQQAATSSSLNWGPAPAAFPAGAQMAVVSGDPTQAGMFTVQLSMPDGYRLPPHSHPTAEHLTVKKGTFLVGMGDTMDLAKAKAMKAGQSGDMPANQHHFAVTRGATVISVSGQGPFAMTYVNPSDDPRGH